MADFRNNLSNFYQALRTIYPRKESSNFTSDRYQRPIENLLAPEPDPSAVVPEGLTGIVPPLPTNKPNFYHKLAPQAGTPNLSRGLRNNNPGNIDRSKIKWEGMADDQQDERFINFESPEFGIRAMARIIGGSYAKAGIHKEIGKDNKPTGRKFDLNTLEGIVHRWAPETENDTQSYIDFVAKQTGLDPTEKLDLKKNKDKLQGILASMIQLENGSMPYDNATLQKGIELAFPTK